MSGAAPPVIDPKIDVYGNDGRTGALADLAEFRAIKGQPMSAAELADLVKDMGWATRPLRQIVLEDDSDDETPDSLADQSFGLLRERIEVLGDRYPFELSAARLKVKNSADLQASPYIALLAITIAHAWNVDCGTADPESALEFVVAAALNHRLAAVGLGTADRAGRSFKENLHEGAAALGLTASPNPTPIRARAKDAGVDTLAGHIWADGRPGHWVFVGQVTCGRTNTWNGKLAEPGPGLWRGYLQEPLTPQCFLAVPHHVDARTLVLLHAADRGVVLDRLRLTLSLDSVVAEAAPIVDSILLASVA